jgi:hypothetical protein
MFHFQELEKPLEFFKICHRVLLLVLMEDYNKLQVFFFLCFVIICNLHNNCIMSFGGMQFLIFHAQALEGQRKDCPIITIGLALLHFLILECLMKESSFGINNFSLLSISK